MSSLFASLIIYLGRFHLGIVLNAIFRNYYPNISGKYLLEPMRSKYGGSDAFPNQKVYVYLEQTVNLVRGHSEVYSGDELKAKIFIKGDISPSRIARFRYETPPSEHHHFGVGLFKISSDGKTLRGHSTVLCKSCEDTTTSAEVLKKLANK